MRATMSPRTAIVLLVDLSRIATSRGRGRSRARWLVLRQRGGKLEFDVLPLAVADRGEPQVDALVELRLVAQAVHGLADPRLVDRDAVDLHQLAGIGVRLDRHVGEPGLVRNGPLEAFHNAEPALRRRLRLGEGQDLRLQREAL